MGKGITLPGPDQAQAIASDLNAMFSADNFEATKARYHALKSHYPALLEHKGDEVGTSRRQRTLRHAGWLLTADVDFGATAAGAVSSPANKFHKWLRWLTWIDQHQPLNSTVTVNKQPSRETPAQAIKETLLQAFNRPNSSASRTSVTFTWQPAAATDTELVVQVQRGDREYGIVVKSKSADELESVSALPHADEDDRL